MSKCVLTIETETEAEARFLIKLIEDEILHPADYYDFSVDFTDFVGKPGELNV